MLPHPPSPPEVKNVKIQEKSEQNQGTPGDPLQYFYDPKNKIMDPQKILEKSGNPSGQPNSVVKG